MSISQILKEIQLVAYTDVDGSVVIKEEELTSLMCKYALTPDEMGRIHETLDLHRIEILPYGNQDNYEFYKELLKILAAASKIIDSADIEYSVKQKNEIIHQAEKLMNHLSQFVCKLKGVSISVDVNKNMKLAKNQKKSNARSLGVINKALIINTLEQLEYIHHNPNGYSPQEILDMVSNNGIDVSSLKAPQANLRGALQLLVSKKLYPEYSKAKNADIVYQPNGKGSGTWRLSKYR